MTNTRMTDVEIFERRYPVILHEFSLRKGSGGAGLYKGGDGVVRDIEFLQEIQASILSEVSPSSFSDGQANRAFQRRVHRPYGLAGGEPAKTGLNLWVKKTRKADGDWRSENDKDRCVPPRSCRFFR